MNELSKHNSMATETMAHQEAARSGAVERYLLDEMSPGERLRFEEHYFTCPVCAEEIAAGQDFISGVRALYPQEHPNRAEISTRALKAPWWKRFTLPVLIPAAAALALSGLVGIQDFVTVPGLRNQVVALRSPQEATLIFAHPIEKGANNENELLVKTQFATIVLDLPDSLAFPQYRVNVTQGGRLCFSKVVSSPSLNNPLALTVNKQTLGTGDFKIKVFGIAQFSAEAKDVEEYSFSIK